jgi:hypothetical protein
MEEGRKYGDGLVYWWMFLGSRLITIKMMEWNIWHMILMASFWGRRGHAIYGMA